MDPDDIVIIAEIIRNTVTIVHGMDSMENETTDIMGIGEAAAEIADFVEKRTTCVQMPQSLDHAKAMHLVSEYFIKAEMKDNENSNTQ